MREYHKIENIFKRDNITKKLIINDFTNENFDFLKNNTWEFTEKVDGTNIRVYWDGYRVSFGGRTDKAQIPDDLLIELEKLFGGPENEQLFEQKFGNKEVILFGEGYGGKIQKTGQLYSQNCKFILFDVLINDIYLRRYDVDEVARYFNVDSVPIVLEGTLQDGVNYVKNISTSKISEKELKMEGLVGRPKSELKDRTGRRIILKIKYEDFK